jgi:hypothetical protein
MFKIIKKGANNFWHYYNNDAKKLYVSKITFNLEEVANTFVLVQANGSNVPANKVLVTDIIVIDKTDASIEETFATAEELRVRLNELGYGVVSSGGGGAVDSVNGQTGIVELDADDIDETSTRKYVSATQKGLIDTSVQPADIVDFVTKSQYTPAHSVLVQQSGTGNPTSVSIGNNEILGRLSGGGSNIKGLSTSEVKTLLDLSGTNSGDNATNTQYSGLEASKQSNAKLISANYTANNNDNLIVNATCTITDVASPSNGTNFNVTIVNGSVTIGGVVYTTLGSKITRVYNSGAWKTFVVTGFEDWTDYSATSTITGFSSFTAKTIRYLPKYKEALFYVNISGVSNSGLLNFTIPFNAIATSIFPCKITNNSLDQSAMGVLFTTVGSDVVQVKINGAFGNFTSSNNKGFALTFSIETN